MIPPEKRELVLKLKALGKKIRWIARHLKIARETVRNIVDPGRKKKNAPETAAKKQSILEPYKEKIDKLLEQDELERKRQPTTKPLTAKRIFKEIRKQGYKGGRTLVDDYVRKVRGPRRLPEVRRRMETGPSEEAQQDWSPYRVLLGSDRVVIQLFSLILCWSRYQFLRAYPDQKLSSLLYGHVSGFRYFDGIPWTIVYDRQQTITPFEIDGEPILTEKFRAFKEHYGFEPVICRPGHKERKGKVERPFDYFERGFLPLRKFESLEDFNKQLRDWLDGIWDPEEGNLRTHGTTGEVPYERWLEEKKYLYELPQTDHLPRRVETRLVKHDCTISVGGKLYSVPARLVERRDRQVWVSIGDEDFLVYDKFGELVARHKISRKISRGKGRLIIDEAHYAEIKRRKRARGRPELEREFLEHFPDCGEFLERLKETVRSIAPIHLREILALARRYRKEEVKRALERAVSDATTTAGYVRQLLSRKHPTGHLGDLNKEPPKGLSLGAVDLGDPQGFEGIFDNDDNDDNDEQEEQEEQQERRSDDDQDSQS
jgi:transposase